MKILLIDNYDSFTWNLFHLIRSVCVETDIVEVVYNDRVDEQTFCKYDKIIISPGPGTPSDIEPIKCLIKDFAPQKSILGVCLGHQAIAEAFGAEVKLIKHPAHGVKSCIKQIGTNKLFKGITESFYVGRYHSWVVSDNDFPLALKITATDEEENIMALSHCFYDVHGLQFHPESIITEYGKQIMCNFIHS